MPNAIPLTPAAVRRARRDCGGHNPPVTLRPRPRLVLGSVAAALVLGVVTPSARADDGLAVGSTARVTLDAKHRVGHTTMTMTFTNEQPNIPTAQGYRYYYFTSFTGPVPASASKVRAVSGGSTLSVGRSDLHDPSVRGAVISFPSRLMYGQRRTVTLSYDNRGGAPRSENLNRVGPGHASFSLFVPGDSGRLSVAITLPKGVTWTSSDPDLTVSRSSGGSSVLRSTTPNTDGGYWAAVSAVDPKAGTRHTVTADGVTYTVRAWADDPRWGTFAASTLKRGAPALQRIVGAPWPATRLDVVEDTSSNVEGWGGYYDDQQRQIVVGEDLDAPLMYHELAHTWASPQNLGSRWMWEGMAQLLSDRTARSLGQRPEATRTVTPTSKGAQRLSAWDEPDNGRADAHDDYGYPASLAVMKQLFATSTPAQLTTVLRDAVTGGTAYDAPGGPHLNDGVTTWQRFLDLVETRGGNPRASAVLRTWVLTPAQAKELTARAGARRSYAALDRADGAWSPPAGLRTAMTLWDFGDATRLLATVRPLAASAAEVQRAATAAKAPVPASVRHAYESAAQASDYRAVAEQLTRASHALEAVGSAQQAVTAGRNPLASLGATALRVDARASTARASLAHGDLTGARTEAEAATAWAGRSTLVGAGILLLVLAALAGLGLLARRLVRRSPGPGRTSPPGPDPDASEDAQHAGVA